MEGIVITNDGYELVNVNGPKDIVRVVGGHYEILPRKNIYKEQFNFFVKETGRIDGTPLNVLGTEIAHGFHVAQNFAVHGPVLILSENDGKDTSVSEGIKNGIIEFLEQ